MDLKIFCLIVLSTSGFLMAINPTTKPVDPYSTYHYILQARFSMGGLRGAVMFMQEKTTTPLSIKVQFDKLKVEGFWGIFANPVIFNAGPADSCASNIVGQLINHGNLTEKHSQFSYKASYSNDQLKAFGKQSILGASLVMIHPVTFEKWGCATILPFNATAIYATATFKGVVAGEIRFLQSSKNDTSEVAIIGNLYYTDGRTAASDNLGWYISTASSSGYNQCSGLTDVLEGKPSATGSCSIHEPQACKMGDLSSKLNNISIGVVNTADRKFRIIDVSLNVSALFGHALIIRDTAGVPFACANIQKSGPISMKASFVPAVNDGVSGSVSFSQDSPYHPTVIDYSLTGLGNKAKGIHVHQYPIPTPSPASPCSGASVGAYLNPYGVNNKATDYPADGSGATLDKYEVGDMSGKFGNLQGSINNFSRFIDVQMDLFGRYSIWNRAVVIHRNDAGGSRWVCANIVPDSVSKSLSSTANFSITSDLVGTVNFNQLMLSDGIMTDTAITVDVAYTDKAKTTSNHNWHIHIEPVGSDAKAAVSSRCMSVGGHYNPFSVSTTAPSYARECSPTSPFRCELGDLNGKHAKYNIGAGKKYFVDSNTPLFGAMSVIGRSVTFHTENAGAPRLACADVVPDSITAVAQIEHSFSESVPFNESSFKAMIMKTLSLKSWQVPYIKKSESKKQCQTVMFYVIDDHVPQNGARYKTKFEKMAKTEQSKLGKYKTCKPSMGGYSTRVDPSIISLVLSSVVFLILTKK